LSFEVGNFAPKIGGLSRLLLTGKVKVFAQSAVFSQQIKREKGSNDNKDCEEDSNQH